IHDPGGLVPAAIAAWPPGRWKGHARTDDVHPCPERGRHGSPLRRANVGKGPVPAHERHDEPHDGRRRPRYLGPPPRASRTRPIEIHVTSSPSRPVSMPRRISIAIRRPVLIGRRHNEFPYGWPTDMWTFVPPPIRGETSYTQNCRSLSTAVWSVKGPMIPGGKCCCVAFTYRSAIAKTSFRLDSRNVAALCPTTTYSGIRWVSLRVLCCSAGRRTWPSKDVSKRQSMPRSSSFSPSSSI